MVDDHVADLLRQFHQGDHREVDKWKRDLSAHLVTDDVETLGSEPERAHLRSFGLLRRCACA